MKVKAKAANEASTQFRVIEKPKEIASTAAASAPGPTRRRSRTRSRRRARRRPASNQANINEKFDSLTAKTPFGGDFTLTANTAGSAGWLLNSSGTMGGPDNVSLSQGVDASPFVKNASNPKPAARCRRAST